MLLTKSIPQYEEYAEGWPRFLSKVSRGSVKATDILSSADMAYLVELTGDEESPSTLHLDDYRALFCNSFPSIPPFITVQEIVDLGAEKGWFSNVFVARQCAINDSSTYENAWARQVELNCVELVNDAIYSCLQNWCPEQALKHTSISELDYNSCSVVAGMLYLSLTWPESGSSEQGN